MPRLSKDAQLFEDLKRYITSRLSLREGDVVHDNVFDPRMHGESDGPHYLFATILQKLREVGKYADTSEELLSKALTELNIIQTI